MPKHRIFHDLCTPLSVIKECIEVIEEEMAACMDRDMRAVTRIAKKNVKRLQQLIARVSLDNPRMRLDRYSGVMKGSKKGVKKRGCPKKADS